MIESMEKMAVYLEVGAKRIFAGAVDWPGWCRSGREEGSALQALCDYGPRYAAVLLPAGFDFLPPASPAAFTVVRRIDGDSTTDFGAPGKPAPGDEAPLDSAELQHSQNLLKACWGALDRAADLAAGKELRKGPRGGGRDLEGILRHVLGADAAYLGRIGWKIKPDEGGNIEQEFRWTRQAILDGLTAAAGGELPARGPRGGAYWTPRYFVRRVAWHALDHAWEIEDRIL